MAKGTTMAPPDFTNATVFPGFEDLPEAAAVSSSASVAPAAEDDGAWFLVAQVKDDMTITKPTLVLSDRAGAPFALVFEGLARDDLDLKRAGLKKGATAVVPGARRTPPREEGKRGFVAVEKGRAAEVRAIPAPLERVVELAAGMRAREEARGGGSGACETCGKGGDGQGGDAAQLLRCTGCGEVRYCSKVGAWSWTMGIIPPFTSVVADGDIQECQIQGWNEKGHKADCKVYKAINAIWK